jgi:ubiquinone/menaquinone biosynthesis C-methylase UbiE
MVSLPYFDLILEARRRGEPAAQVFRSFVHWGFWDDPSSPSADLPAAMERLNHEILAAAELADGQAVLDVGCGFGGTLASIAARHRGMHLAGVNIDARQLLQARNSVAADFLQADALQLPFADASFDRALAVECIFHFASRLGFLCEAARVLKPGGRLTLSDFVPRFAGGAGFSELLAKRVAVGYGEVSAGWHEGRYRDLATAAGLRLVLERDISRQTLPTYPALYRLINEAPELGKKLLWPTRILHGLAWSGLMRYHIVAFEKQMSQETLR